ncbi:MAG: alpha-amlyase [Lysobacterales bacterium]|nr:MAG: alpha-amlyase [Xanthomonadales bacterium]
MHSTIRLAGRLLFAFLLLGSVAVAAEPAGALRVEPPNWWVGFRETSLQLQVYGNDIALYHPSVDYPGVSIRRVEKVHSPNYLFVYLDIAPDTVPGTFDIRFNGEGAALTHPYTLEARNPDPAHTSAYDASDTIYLITPDRFANGDPTNDTVAGMGDAANRSDPNGRHGGDIQGIADHLEYIAGLGFTAIWLNPLLENRMPEVSYHGYSTTDFYGVDPRYGSNESYRELVAQARGKGMGVIMDMIVNHIGSGHWWMDDLPAEDWLNFQDEPVFTSHEHITEQDPYASEYDRRHYSDGWFVDTMPDLNQRNPLLADYLTQNALWWIEYLGLAGIRMDTYPYPDKHYMAEWTRRVMLEYPHFNVVGEEWTDNPAAVAYWQRGQQNRDGYVSHLPSLMDFPLQNALLVGLGSEEGSTLADGRPAGLLYLFRVLANDFVYPDPGALVVFPDNHDLARIYSALGEDPALFRMALAYVLTVRGAPQIYYGTEVLMTSPVPKVDGLLRGDFPGGWPGDTVNAVTGEGLTPAQREAQDFLRTLVRWRRDRAVIHHGELTHFRPQNGTYAWFRHDDDDAVMVVLNKNLEPVELELARFAERLRGFSAAQDVITGETLPLGATLPLPARSVRVLDLR